jgi:hypothetical protein
MPEKPMRPDHVSTDATASDTAALRSGIEDMLRHLDDFAESGNPIGRMTGGDVVLMTADHRVLGTVVVKHTSLNRTSDGVHDVSIVMEDADRPHEIPVRLAIRTGASAPLHPPEVGEADRDAAIRRMIGMFLSCADTILEEDGASDHVLHMASSAVSIAAIEDVQSRDRDAPARPDRTWGTMPTPYQDGSISVSTLPLRPLKRESAPMAVSLRIKRTEAGEVHASMANVDFTHEPDPEDALFRLRADAALIDMLASRGTEKR